MLQSVAFLVIASVFLILSLLLIVQTGVVRLESLIGIARDGIPPGKTAPPWNLPDVAGQVRKTPADDHWQFLIFADHALGRFPDLVAGMHYLASTVEGLEVLVLSRRNQEICEAIVRGLDLQVPVVPVDSALYDYYKVRVMPFVFLLDPHGMVHWCGLVNSKALLVQVWHLAQRGELEDHSLEGVSR